MARPRKDWTQVGKKPCRTCGQEKALTEFRFRKRRGRCNGNYASDCKGCELEYLRQWRKDHADVVREKHRRVCRKLRLGKFNCSTWKRLGIVFTAAQYHNRLKQQGGVCAICRRPNPAKKKRMSLDHNHTTGQVRGIVCDRCNLMIGMVEKEPAIVTAVQEYLAVWSNPMAKASGE